LPAVQDSSTERVGRYQLLEPIGGGPNGSVSRAKVFGVAGFERQFAIKRFLPELAAASSSAQALSAAARSYGSLEHPRIARMSEFGVAQGQTFTAVEMVAGLDVSRLVAESRLGGSGLAAGGSLALISQAARAVGYAHGRGLSHLGLSPTNVIVTAEGDVKVTDFGILAATITAKPVETPRLAYRIGYLAPEQLVGEATSAATDVFVLGVIAYELVTGQRAFFGDAPHEIANKILSGPPADPPLPRPIVRVLARCLARSQFERFPDARAFADALDAALRVAPVPGTRKDIGAQVKATLDRHAAMNEGNLSGVVALPSRPPPPSLGPSSVLADLDLRKQPSFTDHDLELADAPEAVATTEFVRPDVEVPRPARLVGPSLGTRTNEDPASTVPDLKPQITTMPGLVPPPIPATQPMPPPIPMPGNASTMLGLSAGKKPQIPSIKPKSPIPSIVPAAFKPVGAVPSVLPPRPPTGAIPSLRQTQPGQGSVGPEPEVKGSRPSPGPEVDDFGRPKRVLVGPIPGLGAPGRPPSESGATRRAGTDLNIPVERRASSESDVETLAGDEISLERMASELGSDANDEATRPGVYGRAESDFSDLSQDPDPASTMPEAVFARPKLPLQPKHVIADDDPPTAPHDVLPEVHKRGGLQPFAAKRSFADREPTNTSPSIEIIREAGDSIDNLPVASDRQQPITAPPFQRDLPTGEMSPDLVQDLKRASLEEDPLVELALEAHARGAIEVMGGDQVEIPSLAAQRKPTQNPSTTMFGVGRAGSDAARPTPPRASPPARLPSPTPPSLVTPNSGLAMPGAQVPSTVQSLAPPPPPRVQPSFSLPSQKGKARRRWPIALGALVVLGAGSGIAVWQVMQANDGAGGSVAKSGSNVGSAGSAVVAAGSNVGKGSAVVAVGSNVGKGSAVVAAGSNVGKGSAVVAAGSNVGSAGSAAVAAGSNAGSGSNAKPTIAPAASSDALQIASTPPGARVFIDGADQGVTPVKLAGSADRHTMALSAPGFELYVAEVDGHGAFAVPLKAITPNNGPAGIKVIKCKDKDRYYVSVDGKPTGMTCPTERIGTTVGPHTVEVYDLVTESRRKWDINVTDTRLSYRVKID
jgi:serine/threonine protein kinase